MSCKYIKDGTEYSYEEMKALFTAETVDNAITQESIGKVLNDLNNRFEQQDVNISDNPAWEKLYTGDSTITRYFDKEKQRVVTFRVSDAQTLVFRKGKPLEDIISENTSKDSLISRKTGTLLHNYMENTLPTLITDDDLIEKTPVSPYVVPKEIGENESTLKEGLKKIIETINKTQELIDPRGKAKLFLEQMIYDEVQDVGGTSDVLVLYSDGSVGIFDYKFIDLWRFDTKTKKWLPDKNMHYKKIESYNNQISTYKRILTQRFGVKTFRETRIVPIARKQQRDKVTNEPLEKISLLQSLSQISVANEMTNNGAVNDWLVKSRRLRKKIQTRISKREVSPEELTVLDNSINEVIVNMNKEAIVERVVKLLNYIHDDLDSLSISEINNLLQEIEIYGNLDEIEKILRNTPKKEDFFKKYGVNKPTLEEENNFLKAFHKDSLSRQLTGQLNLAKSALVNRQTMLLQELAAERNIHTSLTAPQHEISFFGRMLNNFSENNNPAFDLAFKLIQESKAKLQIELNELEREIASKTKNLSMRDYDAMLKDGKLIYKYSQTFFDARNEAVKNKNINWLVDNLKQNDEDKRRFEEAFERAKTNLERASKGDTEWYNEKLAKLKSDWDISLVKKGKRFVPKNPDAFLKYFPRYAKDYSSIPLSKEYEALTKEQRDFYDFYTEKMQGIAGLLQSTGVYLSERFIPQIRQSFIEKGLSIQGIGEEFLASLKANYEENNVGKIDEATGEIVPELPIMFTTPIDTPSKDLGRSLYLFSNMALNYAYKSNIEETVLALETTIQHQKITQGVDEYGEPKYKDSSASNLQTFKAHISQALYGHSQDRDYTFSLFGERYSLNRIINKTLSFVSTKALAFNVVSAVVTTAGAKMAMWIKAGENRYFNTSHVTKAQKLAMKFDEKYWLMVLGDFDITKDVQYRADNLSSLRLNKDLIINDLFALQRQSDNSIKRNILGAMLLNYTIQGNTIVRKTSPEQKSLYDLAEIVEGKLKLNLPDYEIQRFKNIVRTVAGRITGTLNDDDKSLWKTSMFGKLIGHFRSFLPEMAKERFGELKKDLNTDEYEVGRARVFWGHITEVGLLGGIRNLMNLLFEGLALGYYSPNINQDYVNTLYLKAVNKNPGLTKEAFIELRQGKLRSAARELGLITYLSLLMFLLAGGDDDKDEWYVQRVQKMLRKTTNELTFFYNPQSAQEFMKGAIPLLGSLTDLYNLVTNTGDEIRDTIIGEDSSRDESPILKYTSKMVPIWSSFYNLFDVIDGKPEKGETGIQLAKDNEEKV